MFVSDLRHFLDMPEESPGPALAMASQLFDIVRAATASDPDLAWVSALTCPRRPRNRPCRGYMVVARPDGPGSIDWHCERCGDQGVISGWEDSPFDLRSSTAAASEAEPTRSLVVGDDVAAALRDLRLLDSECERLVYRMVGSADGAVLITTAEDLDELLGFVAAEANHEADRHRRKRLDDAFLVLQGALETFPDDEPTPATSPTGDLEGRWRIVEMDLWDRASLDLVEPAFIDFGADGTGEFRFIAIRGWIDWRVEDGGRVDFTWEGVDEGDQVNGRGWARADANGSLTGRNYIHCGDESSFRAIRQLDSCGTESRHAGGSYGRSHGGARRYMQAPQGSFGGFRLAGHPYNRRSGANPVSGWGVLGQVVLGPSSSRSPAGCEESDCRCAVVAVGDH